MSMDMGPACLRQVGAQEGQRLQATICYDPFQVVALGTKALDEVRRPLWQELRRLPDPELAKKFKGARWALLKNPEDLTERQAETLGTIKRTGGAVWRAYRLKDALRAVFSHDVTADEAEELLGRWC